MGEAVSPVCSPVLLRQNRALRRPTGLARTTLIHDLSMDEQVGFPTWVQWLGKAGITGVDTLAWHAHQQLGGCVAGGH